MHPVQKTAAHAVLDPPAAHPELAQLRGRHDAVLPARDAAGQPIDMNNRRIDAFPGDLRHNRMTDVQL